MCPATPSPTESQDRVPSHTQSHGESQHHMPRHTQSHGESGPRAQPHLVPQRVRTTCPATPSPTESQDHMPSHTQSHGESQDYVPSDPVCTPPRLHPHHPTAPTCMPASWSASLQATQAGTVPLLKASFFPKAPLFPVPPAFCPLPIFLEDTGIE